MPDPRETAAAIIELVFHTPHIDADTQLEEIHLLEQIADIIEEEFDAYEREIEDLREKASGWEEPN